MTQREILATFGCPICGCGPDGMDEDCPGCDRCDHGYILTDRCHPALFDWMIVKWYASICVGYRTMPLGRFIDEKMAARAYDAAASKHFGAFASLNFASEIK